MKINGLNETAVVGKVEAYDGNIITIAGETIEAGAMAERFAKINSLVGSTIMLLIDNETGAIKRWGFRGRFIIDCNKKANDGTEYTGKVNVLLGKAIQVREFKDKNGEAGCGFAIPVEHFKNGEKADTEYASCVVLGYTGLAEKAITELTVPEGEAHKVIWCVATRYKKPDSDRVSFTVTDFGVIE